ncbi:hypothetical protein D9M70_415720 [compost metagenome]
MATSPVVRIVMLINPKQAVHVTHLRLEHDAAHIVVDAHRAHVGVRGVTNPFVVNASRHRVLAELGHKIQHSQLL